MHMAETFFGPWRVVLDLKSLVIHPPLEFMGFVISLSDNADGLYVPDDGVPMDFAVDGAEWIIEILGFFDGTWRPPTGVTRTTRFVAKKREGLTVHLRGSFDFSRVSLICKSMDPETNPIATENPYDFTIPEAVRP